jgi:hypothetical protein
MSSDRNADEEGTARRGDDARPGADDDARPGADDRDTSSRERSSAGGRDVDVPLRVYKTVTVFSTLIAVVCVVLGFVLLDAATLQMSALRRGVAAALGALGLRPPGDVVAGALAAIGLLSIAFGAGVYVFGTRFRPPGMGNSQEDSGED